MKKSILAASLCLLLFACDSESAVKSLTPAQKLAILDNIDTSDAKVKTMDALLQSLSAKFHEPQDTIADYTSRAEGVLKDKGIVSTSLDIMGDLDKLQAPDSLDYRGAITMYLMIRSK
ncbi:hypothetical protein [Dinghuibacter silviterrae]|uniref:Lipoprotein n=1 Tax=Dinghuibacter silviterrae TaxID=1539049 RepID=A0A4R8DKN2_9BACT|nr:hypothetical protein [Dinghuibacter silviterrae]TDW97560.1 hypothetical protein EDB95_5410 [Dinghuibacter silviterrae]